MTFGSHFPRRGSLSLQLSLRPRFAISLACVVAAIALSTPHALAQTPAPRDVPAKSVPVPDTVSPQMQQLIAAPLTPTWNVIPKTAEEWKAQVDAGAAATMRALPALRETLEVKVAPITVDGVKAYMVTPEVIPPENQKRLLVHVHGGCFVSFPGESGTVEAVYMAGFGHFRIISVDYRMPPDHPYPAALDDAMTVWKAASRWPTRRTWRSSAPRPAVRSRWRWSCAPSRITCRCRRAIAPGTPMSDLTNAGDTLPHERDGRQRPRRSRRELRQARRALHQRSRSQGPDALAGLWRHARLSSGDPDHAERAICC